MLLSAHGGADGVGSETTVEIGSTIQPIVLTDSCIISTSISLQAGWNKITLPLEPVVAHRAESVCDEINQQGDRLAEIDRWHNGGWEGHICDLPFNDFALAVGSGYFIRSHLASTWTIEGYEVI